jgi:hypothetical protein
LVLQVERQQSLVSNHFEPAISPESNDTSLGRLLTLFPNTIPLHLPVRVALPDRAKGASETSTILFGVKDTAVLTVDFLLCCGEVVRVRHSEAVGEASAVVVAVIPKGRGTAAALRFLHGAPRWFRKS